MFFCFIFSFFFYYIGTAEKSHIITVHVVCGQQWDVRKHSCCVIVNFHCCALSPWYKLASPLAAHKKWKFLVQIIGLLRTAVILHPIHNYTIPTQNCILKGKWTKIPPQTVWVLPNLNFKYTMIWPCYLVILEKTA